MMVSSKFSQGLPPLRPPPVCKKKLPPGGEEDEGNPDPDDVMENWYDVDVTWFIYRYIFSGTVALEWFMINNWRTPTPPPADGEWASFSWNPDTRRFNAGLKHFVGGVQKVVLTITDAPIPDNPNFNTEQFDYVSALWVGKKHGRIYNLPPTP